MKKFKRLLSVLLVSVMVLGTLTACGNGEKTNGEKIKLVTTIGEDELGEGVYDEFLKTHPNIELEIMPMQNGDTKLLTMIASGDGPDIIRVNSYEELPSFVTRGILMPLDEYFNQSENVNEEDWFDVTNLYRFDGSTRGQGPIYGFLKDWSVDNGLWINKKVFQEAGEPLPSDTEPMTWDEFAALAKRLTVKNGNNIERFGLVTPFTIPTLLEAKLASNGYSMWSEDYKASTLNSDATQEALKYWYDLQSSGAMASTLHPASDGGIGHNMLAEGTTAMVMAGYWLSAYYRENADANITEDLMFIPGPVQNKGENYNVCLAAIGAGVFSGSKHPKEAYELLEFMMMSDKAVSSRASIGWGIPAIRSKVDVLPSTTDFDKQTLDVVKRTIENVSVGSPCLGSGKLITDNGGYDYWGNAVSQTAAPNIGAYNGSAVNVP